MILKCHVCGAILQQLLNRTEVKLTCPQCEAVWYFYFVYTASAEQLIKCMHDEAVDMKIEQFVKDAYDYVNTTGISIFEIKRENLFMGKLYKIVLI